MRFLCHVMCAGVALNVLAPPPSFAMQFIENHLDNTDAVYIFASGSIELNDDEKLHRFVASMPITDRLVIVDLDSRGGSVSEAERLANTIHSSHLITVVPPGAYCASACFLLFAAGEHKFASDQAYIGVHSASSNGEDNLLAAAFTTLFARDAAAFDVPPAIIGKMVATLPNSITWLSEADLVQMGVQVTHDAPAYQPGSPLRPSGLQILPTSQPIAIAPQPPPVAVIGDTSPTFQQGLADRTRYEQWLNGLTGDAKLGASWWAEHRSRATRDHYTCATANASPEFMTGCSGARTWLEPFDRHRLSDPVYRAGWNSL
jgi:hypothetical protein